MTGSYPIHKNIFYLIVLFVLVDCSTVTGLKPIYPPRQEKSRYYRCLYPYTLLESDSRDAFFKVDSLQPTFQWESFPRPQDLRNDKNGLLGQVQNVTYDLKIWRFQERFPAKAIYSRENLPEPLHRIEELLEPSTLYKWSVRARFEVDGVAMTTEWAGIWWRDRNAQRSSVVPNHPTYYRFETPPG